MVGLGGPTYKTECVAVLAQPGRNSISPTEGIRPMKVALIGDVHANLPALAAVLEDARDQGAEAIWNLGDFLGYGPFPEEVVLRLRAERAVCILGNYDAKVLAFEKKRNKWRKTKAGQKYLAFRWAHDNVSEDTREYLRALPPQRYVRADGLRVMLTHGSPACHDEPLGAETPEARLQQLARLAGVEVVACGHTHRAFSRRVSDTWFVNPGSVGRPEGGDPRANWALLDVQDRQLTIDHRRTEYEIQQTVRALRVAGLPEDFCKMFLWGRNLREVQSREVQSREVQS